MKGTIITVLVLAAVVGGLWWKADQRNERIRLRNEEVRATAAAKLREERLALFGEAGLNPDIEWRDTGLGILHLKEGTGSQPALGGFVKFNYIVQLHDGTEVQRTEKPTEARIGQMVSGVSAGLMTMKEGGRAVLFIPPAQGYGRRGFGPIPADAGLRFEVELLRP